MGKTLFAIATLAIGVVGVHAAEAGMVTVEPEKRDAVGGAAR